MKDIKAFQEKEGVCYVYEHEDGSENFTYNELLDIVLDHLHENDRDYDPEIVVKNLFDILDWAHPETYLLEMEMSNDYGHPYYND